jgi:hypothetical protein
MSAVDEDIEAAVGISVLSSYSSFLNAPSSREVKRIKL